MNANIKIISINNKPQYKDKSKTYVEKNWPPVKKIIAGEMGFDKVYLTSDHIQFYEKFGFIEVGLAKFTWGRPTKIYQHTTLKYNPYK